MQLSSIEKLSPYVRLAIAVLSIIYLLGVKSITSVEIPGIEIKFQEIPILPPIIVCGIAFLEILLIIDLIAGATDKRDQIASDQDQDAVTETQVKRGWTPATRTERTRAETTRLKSKLGVILFTLLYVLPMLVGAYCIIHFFAS